MNNHQDITTLVDRDPAQCWRRLACAPHDLYTISPIRGQTAGQVHRLSQISTRLNPWRAPAHQHVDVKHRAVAVTVTVTETKTVTVTVTSAAIFVVNIAHVVW